MHYCQVCVRDDIQSRFLAGYEYDTVKRVYPMHVDLINDCIVLDGIGMCIDLPHTDCVTLKHMEHEPISIVCENDETFIAGIWE